MRRAFRPKSEVKDVQNLLEIKHVTKRFPGVVALSDISFNVKKGEIHALVGENGAGKSTLMKILSGVYVADEGSFDFDGVNYTALNPKHASEIGVRIIHQELCQVPGLTVADNIFLGEEKPWLDDRGCFDKATVLIQQIGLDCSADEQIRELSIGSRQLVEVLKAAHSSPKLLIMDEPTSSLSSAEIKLLFDYMRELKKNGCTIIYISHKLDEILEITDSVTVMRDGKHVITCPTSEVTQDSLISLMVNRNFDDVYPEIKPVPEDSPEVFRVENMGREGVVKPSSFSLRKGEVLGFTGLMGAGRTELMRLLFGVDKPTSGEMYVDGKKVHINSPATAMKAGLGFVTEDRRKTGFVPRMSVRDNITLPSLSKLAKGGVFTRQGEENRLALEYKDRFSIKTPHIFQAVMNLSGGNQQKVILSKWLLEGAKILILDEPTRGIDVNAKREIYNLIAELSQKGMSIIMVSSEINEIMGCCHRTKVMCEGRITGEVQRKDFDYERILELAFERGTKSNEAV